MNKWGGADENLGQPYYLIIQVYKNRYYKNDSRIFAKRMGRWMLEVKDFWRMEEVGGETKTKIKNV